MTRLPLILFTLVVILLPSVSTADPRGCGLPEDVNNDGVVDVVDIQSVAARWGATCQPTPTPDMIARVVWVFDGDTVKLDNDEHLRFIGIDAPELDECYGQEALWANIDLVENETLSLYFDTEHRDPYDRFLAYAILEDGTFANEWLIREGYATTWIISPNIREGHTILDAEDEARAAGRGLWSACQ